MKWCNIWVKMLLKLVEKLFQSIYRIIWLQFFLCYPHFPCAHNKMRQFSSQFLVDESLVPKAL